jgi:hypothetical protein
MIMDGTGEEYFTIKNDHLPGNGLLPVKMKAGGGFLIIL